MSGVSQIIPSAQAAAFDLALCERIGVSPDLVTNISAEVNDQAGLARVVVTLHLPADDVVAMFNAAGGSSS